MKPVDLSLRLLQQYLVVAEEQHFGRAAERLYISQPSLSQAINRLEQCLGVTLLIRTSRAVELTPAGRAFANDARGVIEAQDAAVARAKRIASGDEGELHLGTTGLIAYAAAPLLLRRCRRDLPKLQLRLQDCRSLELVDRVKSGRVDMALLFGPLADAAGLSVTIVAVEPLVIALPDTHRLAEAATVELGDLAGDDFALLSTAAHAGLVRMIVSACQAAGFIPNEVASADTAAGLIGHVASGSCVTLVPDRMRHFAPPGVVFKPLTTNKVPSGTADLTVQILAAVRPDHHDPTIDKILELLHDPTTLNYPDNSPQRAQ